MSEIPAYPPEHMAANAYSRSWADHRMCAAPTASDPRGPSLHTRTEQGTSARDAYKL